MFFAISSPVSALRKADKGDDMANTCNTLKLCNAILSWLQTQNLEGLN